MTVFKNKFWQPCSQLEQSCEQRSKSIYTLLNPCKLGRGEGVELHPSHFNSQRGFFPMTTKSKSQFYEQKLFFRNFIFGCSCSILGFANAAWMKSRAIRKLKTMVTDERKTAVLLFLLQGTDEDNGELPWLRVHQLSWVSLTPACRLTPGAFLIDTWYRGIQTAVPLV